VLRYGCPGVKTRASTPDLRYACFVLLVVSAAVGCTRVTVGTHAGPQPRPNRPVHIQIEQCVDRTETSGRDLGLEATRAFEEKLRAAKEFVVAKSARYRLACEVSAFVDSSAVRPWGSLGWGATVGQVSAMLRDTEARETVMIAEGNASVSGEGLYRAGAEAYIVDTAVHGVVKQFLGWARGESPDAGGRNSETAERGNRQ